MDIQTNLSTISSRIAEIAKKVGRDPQSITLIGISKTKPISLIQHAFNAGLTNIGESYVQEFLSKWDALQKHPIQWHFVGHLQRRKAREVVGKVQLIHSLDSFQLAIEINKRAQALNKVQPCLLQINLAGEKTKSGIRQEDAIALLTELNSLNYVEIKGLMTLPPLFKEPERMRPFFRLLSDLKDLLNGQQVYRIPLTELSMGMSHDFSVAVEEGATLVRIGTALFGER